MLRSKYFAPAVALALAIAFGSPALAFDAHQRVIIDDGAAGGNDAALGSAANPMSVSGAGVGLTNTSGAYSGATVGTSSAQALAAGTAKVFLDLKNESTTASIACAFGATAALNTAGSLTLPPGADKTWEGSFVPSDAVNCIASAASTPLTIGAK